MNWLVSLLLGLHLAVAQVQTAAAQPVEVVNGGGGGTLDGASAFSQFGFGVTVDGAAARGHFECLMAGASAVPGLQLMAVQGEVHSAIVAKDSATFEGVATVNMGNQGSLPGQPFRATVTAGGAEAGTLQLTLLGPDVVMTLPTEAVLRGLITVH
jgi:hypothetical protein